MSIANRLTQLSAMLPPEEAGIKIVMLEAAEALHRKNKYIAELEDKLKTAKADGIREAVDSIEYAYCDSVHIFAGELLEYANQLDGE